VEVIGTRYIARRLAPLCILLIDLIYRPCLEAVLAERAERCCNCNVYGSDDPCPAFQDKAAFLDLGRFRAFLAGQPPEHTHPPPTFLPSQRVYLYYTE